MMEYLDERFPHPPLLPVYPVARAESRLFMHRIEQDWCTLIESIQNSRSDNVVKRSTKELREGILAIAPIFAEKPFFMNDEFTLVDCCIAPDPLASADPRHRYPPEQAKQAAAGLHGGAVQARVLPAEPHGAGARDAPVGRSPAP
jgi:glutathione S-transferase